MNFTGTSGDDNQNGTVDADIFDMSQGGKDTVFGLEGNDAFDFGSRLTAKDRIDGGDGSDTLSLDGDYSAGLRFGANTITGIETLTFAGGHDYDITIADANTSGFFTVFGGALFSGDNLIFDGSRDTDTSISLYDGDGDDVVTGGGGNDSFHISNGGSDTVIGGAGTDIFSANAAFGVGDSLDGGDGLDFLSLFGDYSVGFSISRAMMKNMEVFQVVGDFAYHFTALDGVVAAGGHLYVNALSVSAGHSVVFDAHLESDGSYTFGGGAGDDRFNGGALADVFDLSLGGNDVGKSGDGLDVFLMGAALTADDRIDGGAGDLDVLTLSGDYSGGVVFNANTMVGIEAITLDVGHSYDLTMNNGNLAAGEEFSVDASALLLGETLTFDGSDETDATFDVEGGADADTLTGGNGGRDTLTGNGGGDILSGLRGNDHLIGGDGDDILTGGRGADQLSGGDGADTFVFADVSESGRAGHDTLSNFNANLDKFDIASPVTGVDADIVAGALSDATFESDLAVAVNAANLGAHHAVLFTPDTGDLAGHTFLVIGLGGGDGYQAGVDIVVEIENGTHLSALSTANFI